MRRYSHAAAGREQNKIGTEHDIPHLSRQLIEKYVSDLRGLGLLPR
jgi:fatty acid CoA ligase FadD9